MSNFWSRSLISSSLFASALFSSLAFPCAVLGHQPPERETVITPVPEVKPQAEPTPEQLEAEREIKQEEHQRILGVLPNFNTSSIQHAAKLSPRQKIALAYKTAVDPFTFAVAALDAGFSQQQDSFPGYGQGMAGYGQRVGAAYADSFSGTMIGNAFLPILFREDPRYFRKGTGSFTSRLFYAISTTVRAKSDAGRWVPNYANVIGNITAGGLSNIYYPSSDRGLGLTFQRAFTVTAEGSIGALLVEFWPDVVARHKRRKAQANTN